MGSVSGVTQAGARAAGDQWPDLGNQGEFALYDNGDFSAVGDGALTHEDVFKRGVELQESFWQHNPQWQKYQSNSQLASHMAQEHGFPPSVTIPAGKQIDVEGMELQQALRIFLENPRMLAALKQGGASALGASTNKTTGLGVSSRANALPLGDEPEPVPSN
jgi:hypothetical protein